MNLTSSQVSELLTAHCYRVVSEMDYDDLISYAIQMMEQSFDMNPGQGDGEVDLNMLIEDIWVAEGEDDDATKEFISGCLNAELAEEIMNKVQL